MQEKTFPKFMA